MAIRGHDIPRFTHQVYHIPIYLKRRGEKNMQKTVKMIYALLLSERKVDKGSFVSKQGKTVEYDASYKITVLPLSEKEIQEYKVAKDFESMVEKTLNDLHYGALVELSFEGKVVTNVRVLSDLVYDYEQTNDELDLFDDK